MKIYLINQQDKWCPENNNGDYFIPGCYLKETNAETKCNELDIENPNYYHCVHEFEVLDSNED